VNLTPHSEEEEVKLNNTLQLYKASLRGGEIKQYFAALTPHCEEVKLNSTLQL